MRKPFSLTTTTGALHASTRSLRSIELRYGLPEDGNIGSRQSKRLTFSLYLIASLAKLTRCKETSLNPCSVCARQICLHNTDTTSTSFANLMQVIADAAAIDAKAAAGQPITPLCGLPLVGTGSQAMLHACIQPSCCTAFCSTCTVVNTAFCCIVRSLCCNASCMPPCFLLHSFCCIRM